MKKHLIVGNGGAAISSVKAIRSTNLDDEITIISKESFLAYAPVLATYYLSGRIVRKDMFICDESFYQRNKVNVVPSTKPVHVDTSLKKLYTDSGEEFNYDDLLIASGSSSIVPPIEGVELPRVFVLRTLDDTDRIISFLESIDSVAIIGSGLIAIQALGALVNRGKRVSLLARKHQILRRILDLQGARILEEMLYQKGVDIRLNEPVLRIHNSNGKKLISLNSGDELTADVVILAVGVRPNVDFLQGSSIELNSGVVVDQNCRASIDSVYAAGDVAEAWDPFTKCYTANATWPNALEQGRVAGLNMAGKETSILPGARLNISTLFDFSFASIGIVKAEGIKLDEIVSGDGVTHRKLLFKDGRLIGAVLLGELDEVGIITNLIQRGVLVPNLYEALLQGSILSDSLKKLYWPVPFRLKST